MENKIIDKNFANIKLESLKGLFAYPGYSGETLEFLNDNGVITVEDLLLEKYRDIPEDKYLSFPEKTIKFLKSDIDIAKRLLECKYLGIDPNMNIEMCDNIFEVADILGFSKRTILILERETTYEEFMDIVKMDKKEAYNHLAAKGVGRHASDEIYFKAQVVLKYYNNLQKENKNIFSDESMYFELMELSKQVKELDKKLDSILDRLIKQESPEEIKTYIKSK